MSKYPWPQRLNRITRSSPASRGRLGLLDTARIAWAGSGAGTIPSRARELQRRRERLVLTVGARLDRAGLTSPHSIGASP